MSEVGFGLGLGLGLGLELGLELGLGCVPLVRQRDATTPVHPTGLRLFSHRAPVERAATIPRVEGPRICTRCAMGTRVRTITRGLGLGQGLGLMSPREVGEHVSLPRRTTIQSRWRQRRQHRVDALVCAYISASHCGLSLQNTPTNRR